MARPTLSQLTAKPGPASRSADRRGQGLPRFGDIVSKPGPVLGPVKRKGGGLLGKVARYSGAEFTGNLAKDIGATAVGVVPGIVHVGGAVVEEAKRTVRDPLTPRGALVGRGNSAIYRDVVAPIGKSYADYYGHDLAHHLYTKPLQPILDALTVATGGAAGAAKAGSLAARAGVVSDTSRVARLGERGTVTTRSPRKIATGKGPEFTDLTSTAPLVKARETAVARRRTKRPEGRKIPLTGKRVGGGEVKQYGKQVQAQATQHALANAAPYDDYRKATRGLSHDEVAAMHIRAMDIHPDELREIWRGTPNEADLTPTTVRLATSPSKKMLAAEPVVRRFAKDAEKLLPNLKEETAAARPGLTKRHASESLGRPVKGITGDPYYFPHVQTPEKAVSPLIASGGGKGVPRPLGTSKQNLGRLFFAGKLHLRSDVLGPEFLRRVKHVKYTEIHNGLVRGAVRVSADQIKEWPGGRLPQGWEFVRARIPVREADRLQSQINMLEGLQKAKHVEERATAVAKYGGVEGKIAKLRLAQSEARAGENPIVGGRVERIPPTLRGESETHTPIEKLIPDVDDLHDSQLAKDGFSTTELGKAHQSGGRYYIVPKTTVKAATGEFTRSSDFVHQFVKQPLSVWRAVVLGLRVGFLTNNLVGNSLMYAVKTGGQGALRDLFMSIREHHGPEVAKQVLDNAATPPELRRSLYDEFFPEQGAHGTFGMTQSPSTSAAGQAATAVGRGFRATTGALPKLTSKVAEEAPRRALVRHYIRHSPEFKRVYESLPKSTRSFETAARQVLEGKGGASYQRYVSKRVNQALGDYLHLSPAERNVLRNTLPFYSWYRAITTTTFHLAADTPLRANILGQLGQIGKQWSDDAAGEVPSFLKGAIPLGEGKGGTRKVLATQGLNPYSTLEQLRGAGGDYSSLGLNPFLQGPLQQIQRGKISPGAILGGAATELVRGLPPARLAFPKKPSKIYPNRGRKSELYSFLGAPIKEYNPAAARKQARQGR